jgi:AraC family transcriptional regulator
MQRIAKHFINRGLVESHANSIVGVRDPRSHEPIDRPTVVSLRTIADAPRTPNMVAAATRLLGFARESLHFNRRDAARCISEAADLLRRECDPDGSESLSTSGALLRWQLKRVLDLFESNLHEPIRVPEAAAAARLSISHFTRAFRRSVGEPPSTYLRRLRVQRAEKLMLATDDSLAKIAIDCGFADQSHLCRIFRQVTEMTPSEWRRRRKSRHGSEPARCDIHSSATDQIA